MRADSVGGRWGESLEFTNVASCHGRQPHRVVPKQTASGGGAVQNDGAARMFEATAGALADAIALSGDTKMRDAGVVHQTRPSRKDPASRRRSLPILQCAAIVLASVVAGCSGTPTGSGSPFVSPSASPAFSTAPPTAGPRSTTVPATAAPAGSTRVQLAGPPGHFEPADLTATAGDIAFFLDNTSQGTHSLAIGPALHESLAESANVLNGRAAVFTVSGLKTRKYIIWCTVSNHAAEGMVGTLTVK